MGRKLNYKSWCHVNLQGLYCHLASVTAVHVPVNMSGDKAQGDAIMSRVVGTTSWLAPCSRYSSYCVQDFRLFNV
jgi:hypothetical protein